MYPKNDTQFKDHTIDKVDVSSNGGWSIGFDGWGFFVPKDSPVEPTNGMTARLYGKGIGSTVRGLFLDGKKVYYRTETEDKEYREIESYGKDAADWLARWDSGRGVWSIEMGGIGPGYEQCIHITCAEILRHMLECNYDVKLWETPEVWKHVRDEIEKVGFENHIIKKLGLSGAQWGAAMNLAVQFYRRGPREVMMDEAVKDRHIQVQKNFPRAIAA